MSVLYEGDCLEVLQRIPANTVHCVVTSPPYWSLRDYKVPPSIWGGRPRCDHVWESAGSVEGYTSKKKWQHTDADTGGAQTRDANPEGWNLIEQGKFCTRPGCEAWLGCLGLEPTPELYVAHLVSIFEEVRRVLHRSGTLWLNLGDCYAAGGRGGNTGGASGLEGGQQHQEEESKKAGQRIGSRSSFRRDRMPRGDVAHKSAPDAKPKDLIGIPWMVAFALRACGWYLRSDIIWAKTNPMPESIRDRPTKSHEYMFLLAKSEDYYYDPEPIREGDSGRDAGNTKRKHRVDHGGNSKLKNAHQGFSVPWKAGGGRNRRTVWTLPTAPFKGAHFATFPKRLVEPCILAGSSEHGCCSACGAPFKRILKFGEPLTAQKIASGGSRVDGTYRGKATKAYNAGGAQDPSGVKARILDGMRERLTVGWRPSCRCSLRAVVPCVVMDPFSGAGTTGMVASALGRSFVGIELNPEYLEMTRRRMGQQEHTDQVDDLPCGTDSTPEQEAPAI